MGCFINFEMKQLVAGGGVALIGITLVPLLSGLLGGRIAAGDGRDGQTVINISGGEAVQEAPAPETPEA